MVVRKKPKPLLILIIIVVFLLITIPCVFAYLSSPVDKSSKANIEVVIPNGKGVKEIASILKEKDIIRSKSYFIFYVKTKKDISLKASTYIFKKNMNLKQVIEVLDKGNSYNPETIKLTFKEGQSITDYATLISSNTINTKEQVLEKINDRLYLETLIQKYWFLTEEILQPGIYYPLEGYLFPDTYYFKNQEVDTKTIIETMLDETENKLKPFKNSIGQNIHKYMTLASMLELEGTNLENRKMIAGVFNNRLEKGMNLGSDVTTYYALQQKMTQDLTTAQFNIDNPYNTRSEKMSGKLPIGPICNPSLESIDASINPTESNYLYFVADKNGKIHYTKTLKEHNEKVNEIKKKGDWIW